MITSWYQLFAVMAKALLVLVGWQYWVSCLNTYAQLALRLRGAG